MKNMKFYLNECDTLLKYLIFIIDEHKMLIKEGAGKYV